MSTAQDVGGLLPTAQPPSVESFLPAKLPPANELLASALLLAIPEKRAPIAPLNTTRIRTLTKRTSMWLGQTCNLRCSFCYFLARIEDPHHAEHNFMTLDKAKRICSTVHDVYGNTAIDIEGGEPTIYPQIFELVSHCRSIGLYPTLITNGLVLAKAEKVKRFAEAGVRDFLVSVHGLGPVYDYIVQRRGHEQQMIGLRNLAEVGIPFRYNTVLSKLGIEQLTEISQLAVATGARVVNFLAFNPFEDQRNPGFRSQENVPRYSDVGNALDQSLDLLAESKVEANVRYIPFCMVSERHWPSIYNFQQLSYDHHEWDYASWNWTGLQEQRMKGGDLTPPPVLRREPPLRGMRERLRRFKSAPIIGPTLRLAREAVRTLMPSRGGKAELYRETARARAAGNGYRYAPGCRDCALMDICDGVHVDYVDIFGIDEIRPIRNRAPVTDPTAFIRLQEKVVEPEDESWALAPNGAA